MTTLTVDDEVVSRLEAVAAPEEDVTTLAKTAMIQFIERRERQAAGHAEMQAMLDGPRRSHEESIYEQLMLRRPGNVAMKNVAMNCDAVGEDAECPPARTRITLR